MHKAFRVGSGVWERPPQQLCMLPWPAESACVSQPPKAGNRPRAGFLLLHLAIASSICTMPSPRNSTLPLALTREGKGVKKEGSKNNNVIAALSAETNSNALTSSGLIAVSADSSLITEYFAENVPRTGCYVKKLHVSTSPIP